MSKIDLNEHPLTPFFQEVVREYEAGLAKYGSWHGRSRKWQKKAVKSEIHEVKAAMLKDDGNARLKVELPQLANVCGKMWVEI